MIYRAPLKERIGFILGTLLLAGLVAWMVPAFLKAGSIANKLKAYKLGGAVVLTGFCAYGVYLSWRAQVRVDDRGVDWREGGEAGSLTWDQIQGLGGQRKGKYVRPCLVDKSSRNHLLPFLTPELYRELKGRCGPLPPDDEADLRLNR
jgi:hypothetical protein